MQGRKLLIYCVKTLVASRLLRLFKTIMAIQDYLRLFKTIIAIQDCLGLLRLFIPIKTFMTIRSIKII